MCEKNVLKIIGGLAQLARACDWQSQGREFDSPNLHLRPPKSRIIGTKEGFSFYSSSYY